MSTVIKDQELSEIQASYPHWNVWKSRGGRPWATRRGNIKPTSRKRDAAWAMTIDAETPAELVMEIEFQDTL